MDINQAASIQIYDVFTAYREGSNLKKKKEHEKSVIELLQLPDADPKYAKRGITYFGSVNYSVPSEGEGVVFEGDYYRQFPDAFIPPANIKQLLGVYKFNDDAEDSSKVPCVIIANLVTPRRDPHGQDK